MPHSTREAARTLFSRALEQGGISPQSKQKKPVTATRTSITTRRPGTSSGSTTASTASRPPARRTRRPRPAHPLEPEPEGRAPGGRLPRVGPRPPRPDRTPPGRIHLTVPRRSGRPPRGVRPPQGGARPGRRRGAGRVPGDHPAPDPPRRRGRRREPGATREGRQRRPRPRARPAAKLTEAARKRPASRSPAGCSGRAAMAANVIGAIRRRIAMAKQFGSAAAFKASLEAHLRKRADERGVPFSTLQLKFVIERLLARLFRDSLAAVAPEGRVRDGPPLPPAGADHEGHRPLRVARRRRGRAGCPRPCGTGSRRRPTADLGDYLTFRIGEPKQELTNAPQGGARYPCEAVLLGKTYAKFHIDVGVGDAVVGEPERLTGDDLLGVRRDRAGGRARDPEGPAVRREGPRLHLPVGGAAQHPHEGLGGPGAPHRARTRPTRGRSGRRSPPPSRRAGRTPLPSRSPRRPRSWAKDFPGMAEEANLSSRDYLVAFRSSIGSGMRKSRRADDRLFGADPGAGRPGQESSRFSACLRARALGRGLSVDGEPALELEWAREAVGPEGR